MTLEDIIKMAQEAERKAKLNKDKGPKKVAEVNLSQKWINWVIIGLLIFQVYLNIAAYNAAITGLNNLSLFGLVLAIGLVVDDPIVVVEAVEHYI